ncbi:MAG TPA: hypothetical protein VFW46_04815 [Stellaceae bacterium]|jgi:hypothetical protein|nr:hypothetical protein [Stellaceae bacterium]
MRLAQKLVLGAAAALLASAASFPHEIAAIYKHSYPTDARKRDALQLCQQQSGAFIRYLASEREDCYARMRIAVGDNTGVWSKHDRSTMHLAQLGR